MRFALFTTVLGFNGAIGPMGVELAPPDPDKPDPRASAEMEAFDLLPAEARAAVRDSANDVGLAGKLARIRQIGAPRAVLERARVRGLMPFQLGEGGILAEIITDEIRAS